ncbi:MAG: SARP family transcriptional regulator [Firmicutes bacterium]|nr:SARP family transcriptional regulator [Bacillota bacterium]
MDTIRINLLGEFSISFNGRRIDDSGNRSRKVWLFLEYLAVFRDRTVSQSELIDILWPEAQSNNPVNALKTLLFRARSTIDEMGLCGKSVIAYKRGAFSLNFGDANVEVDTVLFEALLEKANKLSSNKEKRRILTEALLLYKGDFLPRSANEAWVVPISAHLHSLYISSALTLCDILNSMSCYDEIIRLCRHAVNIDPYEERLHFRLIEALVKTGAQQRALQHYNYVKDLFFSQFGINPSQELTALYREVVKTSKATEMDLSVILDGLKEENARKGAFFCEYEFFKNVYQIYARSAVRTGLTAYICLVTMTDGKNEHLSLKSLNRNMSHLSECICDALRRGDIYTRYSVSQYILLLSSLSYENAEMIMNRISKKFRAAHPKTNISLIYSFQPLIPIDLES